MPPLSMKGEFYMSAKQDRQGVRTAAQLEQKVGLTKRFAEVMGIATAAREAVDESTKTLEAKLTTEEIFNLLTNYGQAQGLYRGEDGELYINASYIVAGILKSLNNATKLNLDDGAFTCTDENGNTIKMEYGQLSLSTGGDLMLQIQNLGFGSTFVFWNPFTKVVEGSMGIDGMDGSFYIDCDKINPGKKVLYSGNVTAGNTFEVPLTKHYDLFAVKLGVADSTEDTVVLAYKNGNTINGVGGWAGTASLAKELFFLSATFEGTTWTVVDARKQGVYNAGSITTGTALNVKEVVGVI